MHIRPLFVAVFAAAALLAAGCGGSSDTTSSDTAASDTMTTEKWADGLCSSITVWTSSLTSVVDTVKGGDLSQESLTGAVDAAKTATDTFTTSLAGLGKPDSEAGQQAKDSVDQLATDIRADMTKIEDAVAGATDVSGVLNAVSVVTSTLATAGQQVSSTLTGLQGAGAKGELESAFKAAPSCQSLTGGA